MTVYYTPGVSDSVYPTFSNLVDDNSTLIGSGTGHFNVTVIGTNGTVLLNIDGTNVTATNTTRDVYNVSYVFSSANTYPYHWASYGNGSSHNFNVSQTNYYTVNASANCWTKTSNVLFIPTGCVYTAIGVNSIP